MPLGAQRSRKVYASSDVEAIQGTPGSSSSVLDQPGTSEIELHHNPASSVQPGDLWSDVQLITKKRHRNEGKNIRKEGLKGVLGHEIYSVVVCHDTSDICVSCV